MMVEGALFPHGIKVCEAGIWDNEEVSMPSWDPRESEKGKEDITCLSPLRILKHLGDRKEDICEVLNKKDNYIIGISSIPMIMLRVDY
jgi:hypothetical protein